MKNNSDYFDKEENNTKEIKQDNDILVINNFGKKDENIKKEKESESENENNENNFESKLIQYNYEIEEEPKPENERQKYLNKELNEFPDEIVKGVSTQIENSLMQIQDEFKTNELNISNNQKDVSELINSPYLTSVPITNLNHYNQSLKTIHNLKIKEKGIKQNLLKLNQNEKILQNDTLENNNLNEQFELNKKLKEEEIKKIKNKQKILLNQLEDIQLRINLIFNEEQKTNKKLNLKDFIDKYDNENINNERIYELEKQSFMLRQKRINDVEKTREKIKKKMDELEKEEKQKKKQFLINQREKERELILKRKKEMDDKLEKTKKYINAQQKLDEKEYLFYKMKNKYDSELDNKIKKIKLEKRKNNLVTKEEIKNLQRKLEENRILIQKDLLEKTKNMKEMWRNRSLNIPNYKSPFLKILQEEENKLKEIEENEKLKKKLNLIQREKYSIEKVPKPKEINPKLLRQRKERIFRISDLRGKARIKYIKQKFLNQKKKENNLCIKQGNKVLKNNENYEFNLKKGMLRSISEINIHNDNKKKINSIVKKIPTKLPKDFDYLKELRELNPKKNNLIRNFNWTKLANNKSGNKIENIQIMKNKIDSIDENVRQKQEFLKINGGTIHNFGLANRITDLLIDSIKGKLTIIDTLKHE